MSKDSVYTTFTVDKKTAALLNRLKEELGASSKADVIRKAIALMEMAREAQERGGHIAIEDKDGVHRILIAPRGLKSAPDHVPRKPRPDGKGEQSETEQSGNAIDLNGVPSV